MKTFTVALPDLPQRACREADPELFFNESRGRPSDADIWEAKLVCSGCPEALKCLQWALDNDEQGVWGGTTDEERRKVGRKQKMTREQRRRDVSNLHAEGFSDNAIAERLGFSRSAIQNDRDALGLPENGRVDLKPRRMAVQILHARGLNDIEIAKKLGSNRDAVRRDRLALGLKQNRQDGAA